MKKLLVIGWFFSLSSWAALNPYKFIVKLKPNVKVKSLELFSQKNVQKVRNLSVSLGNFAVLETSGLEKSQLDEMARHPDVEYIEASQTFTVSPLGLDSKEIRDAKFSNQWGLKNTGRNSGTFFSPGKKGEDINAEKVWNVSRGNSDVVVAVIDTGVDYNHRDLKRNMWFNLAEKEGQPGVDDDGNGFVDDIYGYDFSNNDGDPMDGHSHGTHCAGVIGAVHNDLGIRGVMNNVKMMAIKFLSDSGRGETEEAIKAIDYAVKMGAHILSNSWGGDEFSQALKDSIEKANEAGVIFVAAAGNSYRNNDENPSYPANYELDNVISVGAMDGRGRKASFSNYGKKVHVFAPGKSILSTVPSNRYKKMSGTSMACPMVAGGLGLLLSQNPNMTPLEAREQLMATAVRKRSFENMTASGRMDAYRLLLDRRN